MTTSTIPIRRKSGSQAPKRSIAGVAIATLVAFAVILSASRFIRDSQVAQDPGCRAPDPTLTSSTLAAIAMQCLGDVDKARANGNARLALRRQPRNQLALAVLGSLADLDGDKQSADSWMSLAANLGHRDYAVETYWIARDAERRRFTNEAAHIDAFFRAGWQSDDVTDAARQLEASAVGRAALLAVLRKASPWAGNYLGPVHTLSDGELENRRLLLLQATRTRAMGGLQLESALSTMWELQQRGREPDARLLRAAYQPFDPALAVQDPTFLLPLTDHPSPFDWHLSHATGLETNAQSGGGLQIRALDPARYEIVRQTIVLPPGLYRAAAVAERHTPTEARLIVSLRPRPGGPGTKTISATAIVGPMGEALSLPLGQLAGPYDLVLLLDASDGGDGVDLTLRNVSIVPAP